MQTEPGSRASTSSRAVCGFMQTMMSTSFLRAIQPSLFARMVNQVGRPAMLEGNMFFPLTGTPIWKIERIRTLFDDCDPEPLTVATWMVQSLTMGRAVVWGSSSTAVMVESDTCGSSSISGWAFYSVGRPLLAANYNAPMLRTVWAALVALVVTIPISSAVIVVALVKSNARIIDPMIRLWAWLLVKGAGIDLRVEGLERVDPKQRYVLIGNHSSYFDIPCVFAAISSPPIP